MAYRAMSASSSVSNTKNTYYDVLYQSQRNWHEGTHSIWPWVTYLAEILADSYHAFELRVAAAQRNHRNLTKNDHIPIIGDIDLCLHRVSVTSAG